VLVIHTEEPSRSGPDADVSMSGIIGLVAGNSRPVDRALLERLTGALVYRGPDRTGVWCSAEVGFGHTLLATTFEALRELQPYSLDGNFYITADCRIDGRDELRRELERHGLHSSGDATDPDLILHAYAVWQEGCIDHLIGDFAFAIWDQPRRRLFCARDHSGVKPFYFSTTPDGLIFSNTLIAIRLHPAISGRLDESAILDYLLFGQNLDVAKTSFADIRSLPPAHRLVWQDGTMVVTQYWKRPVDEPLRYRRSRDYVDHFQQLLDTSVRDRLRNSKVSVQMSGGLDSTLLAATAKKVGDASLEIHAHSIYFENLIPDRERHLAEIAAKHIGIPLHLLCSDGYKPFQRFDEIAARLPHPTNYPQLAVSVDLRERMAGTGRIYFYGEGPDNMLGFEWRAYLRYLLAKQKFRPFFDAAVHSLRLDPRLPLSYSIRRRTPGNRSRRPEFPDWILPEMVARHNLRERWQAWLHPAPGTHPYHPNCYQSLAAPDWLDLFVLPDPGVSGLHLECRHPFLDIRLARFLLALPVIPWCRRKLILREAAKDRLPREIWTRDKTSLARDPNLAQQQRGNFTSLPPPPLEEFAEYVSRWPEVDPTDSWSFYQSTFPVSLRFWAEAQNRSTTAG
jgi:asparagine synthase (glutamine-hydrolysing)